MLWGPYGWNIPRDSTLVTKFNAPLLIAGIAAAAAAFFYAVYGAITAGRKKRSTPSNSNTGMFPNWISSDSGILPTWLSGKNYYLCFSVKNGSPNLLQLYHRPAMSMHRSGVADFL